MNDERITVLAETALGDAEGEFGLGQYAIEQAIRLALNEYAEGIATLFCERCAAILRAKLESKS